MHNADNGNQTFQPDGEATCELNVHAKAMGNAIHTQLQLGGKPESGRQAENMALNIVARAMAFLYEGALIGSGRENTPEGRAIFFAGLQAPLMHMFLGLAGSEQFQRSVTAHREAAERHEPDNS